MFTLNDKRINIDAPFTTADGITFASLRSPEARALVGVVEIPDPVPPADYSEETYYRTEQDDAPYVVFTRKSDEQINAARKARIQAQIDTLESSTLLPRVTREFMLLQFAAVAAQQGIDPLTNIAYQKVKELDDKITALRNQLV